MVTVGNELSGDVIEVSDCSCVSKAYVYGLRNSIRAAKLPKSTDVNSITSDLTLGIANLGTSPKGEGHDNWLSGIVVQADFKFSNKVWVEMERYHFLQIVSSQSTMHKITKFNFDESYTDYVDPRIIEIMKEKRDAYNRILESDSQSIEGAYELNRRYLELLYSNPAGFILTARVTTNYRQLKTIYSQRKNHRLPEWRTFCEWIEKELPMSNLITGKEVNS